MNTLKLILILLVIFILFSKSSILEQPIKKVSEKVPTPVLTSVPEEKIITSTKAPTKTPALENEAIKNTPTPTQEVKQVQGISDTWFYPGAQQIGVSGATIILQSYDDITQITNWYKDKIKASGMNAISFVTTKTNGDVLNKLSGAGAGQDVTVEITKSNSDQQIKISITIKSS